MGGKKLYIIETIYNITPGIQKILTDTTNVPLQMLNDQDTEMFINILENLDSEKYKPIRGEPKPGRFKQSEINFNKT